MWYTVTDVMILLGVAQTKAYEVIRTLGDEIAKTKMPDSDRCYARPPAGRIQKSYFCDKFMFDRKECDYILRTNKGVKARV